MGWSPLLFGEDEAPCFLVRIEHLPHTSVQLQHLSTRCAHTGCFTAFWRELSTRRAHTAVSLFFWWGLSTKAGCFILAKKQTCQSSKGEKSSLRTAGAQSSPKSSGTVETHLTLSVALLVSWCSSGDEASSLLGLSSLTRNVGVDGALGWHSPQPSLSFSSSFLSPSPPFTDSEDSVSTNVGSPHSASHRALFQRA